MRAMLLASLLVLTLVPTANAAPSSLTLELPEGDVTGNTIVPVVVRLTLSDFMCHEPRDFVVTLASNATEGVKAVFERSSVTFPVESRSYFVVPYQAEATVNLTVRAIAAGGFEVSGAFSADDGPCFVPGGFTPATFTVSRLVSAGSGEPIPPAATPTPEGTTTTTNTTPTPDSTTQPAPSAGANSTAPQEETPVAAGPTASVPTPATASTTGCAPSTTCGVIGEYEAPQESASEKGVSGIGVFALFAALGCLALLLRRR